MNIDIMSYVDPKLIVVAVACLFLGVFIKHATVIKNSYIPFILIVVSVMLCGLWVFANTPLTNSQEVANAIFSAITQGVLMAGLAVLLHQCYQQGTELKNNAEAKNTTKE